MSTSSDTRPKFGNTGAVSVYNGDVVKSDAVIPGSLRAALKKALKPLEDNEKVLDIVYPSLSPLIYGRSRILSIFHDLTTASNASNNAEKE